jgi:hypothetical protein
MKTSHWLIHSSTCSQLGLPMTSDFPNWKASAPPRTNSPKTLRQLEVVARIADEDLHGWTVAPQCTVGALAGLVITRSMISVSRSISIASGPALAVPICISTCTTTPPDS